VPGLSGLPRTHSSRPSPAGGPGEPPLACCASSFRYFCKPFASFGSWALGTPANGLHFFLSSHPISGRSTPLVFPVFLLTKLSHGHHPASHSFSTPETYRISVTLAVAAVVRTLYTRSDPTLTRIHRTTRLSLPLTLHRTVRAVELRSEIRHDCATTVTTNE